MGGSPRNQRDTACIIFVPFACSMLHRVETSSNSMGADKGLLSEPDTIAEVLLKIQLCRSRLNEMSHRLAVLEAAGSPLVTTADLDIEQNDGDYARAAEFLREALKNAGNSLGLLSIHTAAHFYYTD